MVLLYKGFGITRIFFIHGFSNAKPFIAFHPANQNCSNLVARHRACLGSLHLAETSDESIDNNVQLLVYV
jgi:hypothetical protein